MKKIFVIITFSLIVVAANAQFIGSQYLTLKAGYIVDENQIQVTIGTGKVFKSFKVGANLNYRNLDATLVKANTITAEPEFLYYLFRGNRFSLSGLVGGVIGFQKAETKTNLVMFEKSGKNFVYGYNIGIRPEVLISPKAGLFFEYRYEMLFNSAVKNNNQIGIGVNIYL